MDKPLSVLKTKTLDKYEEAIEYLMEHPEKIIDIWNSPWSHSSGCLFAFISKKEDRIISSCGCGCLTEIRAGKRQAFDAELTVAIRADERIPAAFHNEDGVWTSDIKVEDLSVFAEWQRKVDGMVEKEPNK